MSLWIEWAHGFEGKWHKVMTSLLLLFYYYYYYFIIIIITIIIIIIIIALIDCHRLIRSLDQIVLK